MSVIGDLLVRDPFTLAPTPITPAPRGPENEDSSQTVMPSRVETLVNEYASKVALRERPCPCGSRRAYRRCCYAADRSTLTQQIFHSLADLSRSRHVLLAQENGKDGIPLRVLSEDIPFMELLAPFAPLLLTGPNPLILNAVKTLIDRRVHDTDTRKRVERALWNYAAPRGTQVGLLPTVEAARDRAVALHGAGLVPLALREGGLYYAGTRIREVADNPPSIDEIRTTDYQHGIAVVLGTPLASGGYTLGIDIDHGPQALGTLNSAIMVESGTASGRWHIINVCQDRLDGVINIYYTRETELQDGRRIAKKSADKKGPKPVAEIKGYGLALRGWPAIPADKPNGYTPLHLGTPPPATETAHKIAYDLAMALSQILGEPCVAVTTRRLGAPVEPILIPTNTIEAILAKLDASDVRLGRSSEAGDQLGFCPFHEDRNPSFSLNLKKGLWQCFAGCGKGTLPSLAKRLGVPVAGWYKAPHISLREEPERLTIVEDEIATLLDPLAGIELPDPTKPRAAQQEKTGPGLAGSRHASKASRRKAAKTGITTGDLLDLIPETVTPKSTDLFTTGLSSDNLGAFSVDQIQKWEAIAPLRTPRHLFPRSYLPSKAVLDPLLRAGLRRAGMKADDYERRLMDLSLCGACSKVDSCQAGHVNAARHPYFCQLPFHDCAGRQSWRVGRLVLPETGRYVQWCFIVPESRVHEIETGADVHERSLNAWDDDIRKLNSWQLTKGMVAARSAHANLGREESFLMLRVVIREDVPGAFDGALRRLKDLLGRQFDLKPGHEALFTMVEADLSSDASSDDVVEWLMDMCDNHLQAIRGEDPQTFADWYMVTRGRHLFQSYGLIADLIDQVIEDEAQEKEERPPILCETCGQECKVGLAREEKDGTLTWLRRPNFNVLPRRAKGERRPPRQPDGIPDELDEDEL